MFSLQAPNALPQITNLETQVMETKPGNLFDPSISPDFMNMASEITEAHNFLKQVMRGSRIPSAGELPELQKTIERFAIGTSMASKIITNMIKNIDTLVRLQ